MTTTIVPRLSYETILDGSRSCPELYWQCDRGEDKTRPESYNSRIINVHHYADPAESGKTIYQFLVLKEDADLYPDVDYRLILSVQSYCNGVHYSDNWWSLGLFAQAKSSYDTINNLQKYAKFALETVLSNDGSMVGLPGVESYSRESY